eukprot:1627661-Rhodomonas_salina.1
MGFPTVNAWGLAANDPPSQAAQVRLNDVVPSAHQAGSDILQCLRQCFLWRHACVGTCSESDDRCGAGRQAGSDKGGLHLK